MPRATDHSLHQHLDSLGAHLRQCRTLSDRKLRMLCSLEAIDANYKRYLEKHFRESFSLTGTPLRIELRSGKNPFSRQE